MKDNLGIHQEDEDHIFHFFTARTFLPPRKTGFPVKSFSLTEAQLLTQERDLHTALASLSLKMWGSNFLASMIMEESSISPSPFLSSLEAMVWVSHHFNLITARHLINLMAETTLSEGIAQICGPPLHRSEKGHRKVHLLLEHSAF